MKEEIFDNEIWNDASQDFAFVLPEKYADSNSSGVNLQLEDFSIKKTEKLFLIEAIGWGTVGIWLAQGAVSYLGGLAMSSILGHPSLADIEELIKKAVKELKSYIRSELQRQIRENEINKLRAHTDSIVRNLRRFGVAPQNERSQLLYLLQDADINTSEILSLAISYDMMAASIYSNATSLRVLSFVSYYETTNSTVHLYSAKNSISEAKIWINKQLKKSRNSWEPKNRLTALNKDSRSHPCLGTYDTYWFKKDGRRIDAGTIRRGQSTQPATAKYNRAKQEVDSDFTNVLDNLHAPLLKVLHEWDKTIKKCDELINGDNNMYSA